MAAIVPFGAPVVSGGLASILPKPQGNYETFDDTVERAAPVAPRAVPPYGRRADFVPRSVEDFGDGGAFPEVHVAQYPLDMGRPGAKSASTDVVSVEIGADGAVKYDAIVTVSYTHLTLPTICSV